MEEVKHMVRTVAVTTKGPWNRERKKRLTPTTTTVRVKSRKLLNSYECKYNTEIPRGIKDSMAPVSYFNTEKTLGHLKDFIAHYISGLKAN